MTVDFGRVLTAMATPFNAAGELDCDVAGKLASHLVDTGTDTLVVCGTTGESPTLTWDEEYRLFQSVMAATAGRGKVMAGTGSNSTREAIEATQKAEALGVDGAMLVVPYYNKPPQVALIEHFSAIAAAVTLPILLYNVPGRTGCTLLPETVAQLATIPNIVALKQASGNLDHASEIRRQCPAEFELYSGEDSLTLPMLSLGAKGVVSVASHVAGIALQDMIQAFTSGDVQKATDIHLRLMPLFKVLFATTNPIPVKAALRLQGWDMGECRPPLSGDVLSDDLLTQLKAVLADLSLLP